jgi:hypothetical protein
MGYRLDPIAFNFSKDKGARIKIKFRVRSGETRIKRAEATRRSFGFHEASHQLVDMPAANDERTLEHLAQYLAGFFTAFGILQ